MDSVRLNYNKIGEHNFSVFIDNIKKEGSFKFMAHHPANESVMQDRYTFNKKKCRISIVYETKPQTLIITAPKNVIDEVKSLLPNTGLPKNEQSQPKSIEDKTALQKQSDTEKEQLKPSAKKEPKTEGKKTSPKQPGAAKETKTEQEQPTSAAKEPKTKQPKSSAKKEPKTEGKKTSPKQPGAAKETKTEQEQPTPAVKEPKTKQSKSSAKKEPKTKDKTTSQKQPKAAKQSKPVTHENSFIVKKISPEKFSELLKKIKANKNMRYKQTSASGQPKSYTISSQKEKVTLRYLDGNIELSGLRGDLYGEIQLYMSQLSDYKTAIKTHIQFSGEEKKARDIERQLKKKLPDAYEFLSEQSKLDLAIGVIDINNSEVVLSDYSTLLIPCFRGLERFIFDLQHAQGIVVKMIGQAFEKDEGNYVLKSGYRRKIPSVIYPEVMAALYTEYFKQRNFYAHSDGGFDNISRIISDKAQVQSIFNHILEVINYNGKKLKEIGFTIK